VGKVWEAARDRGSSYSGSFDMVFKNGFKKVIPAVLIHYYINIYLFRESNRKRNL